MSLKGMVGIYADKDLKTATKNIKCPLHHTLKPGLPYYEALCNFVEFIQGVRPQTLRCSAYRPDSYVVQSFTPALWVSAGVPLMFF